MRAVLAAAAFASLPASAGADTGKGGVRSVLNTVTSASQQIVSTVTKTTDAVDGSAQQTTTSTAPTATDPTAPASAATTTVAALTATVAAQTVTVAVGGSSGAPASGPSASVSAGTSAGGPQGADGASVTVSASAGPTGPSANAGPTGPAVGGPGTHSSSETSDGVSANASAGADAHVSAGGAVNKAGQVKAGVGVEAKDAAAATHVKVRVAVPPVGKPAATVVTDTKVKATPPAPTAVVTAPKLKATPAATAAKAATGPPVGNASPATVETTTSSGPGPVETTPQPQTVTTAGADAAAPQPVSANANTRALPALPHTDTGAVAAHPLGPAPKLTTSSRWARVIAAGLAPHARPAGSLPATKTSGPAYAGGRPPGTTSFVQPLVAFGGIEKGPKSPAIQAPPAVAVPRLGDGPVPPSLLRGLLALLAGLFAVTLLVHAANRSLATSRTRAATPAARWLSRLEVSPWLAGTWVAGAAFTLWLVSQA